MMPASESWSQHCLNVRGAGARLKNLNGFFLSLNCLPDIFEFVYSIWGQLPAIFQTCIS